MDLSSPILVACPIHGFFLHLRLQRKAREDRAAWAAAEATSAAEDRRLGGERGLFGYCRDERLDRDMQESFFATLGTWVHSLLAAGGHK